MGKHNRPGPRTDQRLRKDHHRPHKPEAGPHDTYSRQAKPHETIVCDRCGVVFHAGRWTWGAAPLSDSVGGLCPACQRISDRYPAGTIRLPEEFLAEREEVLDLIRNAEATEKPEHPLERLMELEETPGGGLVVTTTGIHLARAITSKLERRFHKQARICYLEEQKLINVDWDE